jgi:transposase-like protein
MREAPSPVEAQPRRVSRQIQRRLTPPEVEQFKQDYRDGTPINELANRYRIDKATVHKRIVRLGLPRRKPCLSPAAVAESAAMNQSGRSLLAIGRHLGVAQGTVALALRKAGVSLRPRRGWDSTT